ncbi:class I SAM-dependent methyltransferase [Yinghuangia soli]|uniref:Class I SAM-dependent methyltransferase n=1 Tax=Yinghuangia soli TaxID=2908204 RepID=A0AA41Q581_9ACTN|nr:class I SAM-dependent methyltransferase [Yinghuangia soli]MCF2531773.1 class I SAM-dependent methyltransferase [Yinghuangia soli]
MPVYDRIGAGYNTVRHPDPRLGAVIGAALAGARTVVNIGAGTGAYEPEWAEVTAVDPSDVMLAAHPGARKVRAFAEELPFEDGQFDAAMAVMTIHHWTDFRRGLAEMRRVSRRQVLFLWDPGHDEQLWIVRDYLPELRALDLARCPALDDAAEALGAHTRTAFPIPHDFTDGSQYAYWRRPHAYLDSRVRLASSPFAQTPWETVRPAVARLADDLATGAWQRRYADLLDRESVDYGFRLLTAGEPPA